MSWALALTMRAFQTRAPVADPPSTAVHRRRRLRAGGLGAVLLVLTACTAGSSASEGAPTTTGSSAPSSASSSGPSSAVPAGGVPRPDHVIVVVFENQNADSVVGSRAAPYLTGLAAQGANFTDSHGITHPSQPNYLALFSGSTQGVSDDSCPKTIHEPNLAGQLIDAGDTFGGYSEGLPIAGSTTCDADGYARRHNPWVNFPALPAGVNQPFSALPSDYTRLPTVSFVVPNLCHDMHDCGVGTGDKWAKQHLQPYVDWARGHNSLLIVTFDENDGSGDNQIATFMVGPMVTPGPSAQRIDHYSVLRTLEEMYGLAPLGEAARRDPVTGVWSG